MPETGPSTSVQEHSTPAPAEKPMSNRPGLWRRATFGQRLVAVAAALGTVIGILSIVVPLAFVAVTRPTSTDTVAVATEEVDGGLEAVSAGLSSRALAANVDGSRFEGLNDFAVPVDAPWEELWALMDPAACTADAQLEWLNTHGTVIPAPTLTARITNTADSGSDLVVSDVRAQGELTPPPGDTVTVAYYGCIGAGDEGIYAHLTIGADPVAVYDDCYATPEESCYFGIEAAPVPGDPVVFPIRPGETRILHLTYDQVVDFRGRFVATVTADGEESTIDLTPDGADVVAPVVTREAFLRIAGNPADTSCTPRTGDTAAVISACTLADWQRILGDG